MYEILYIFLYYIIVLSLLYLYKRYKEEQTPIEYIYKQIEMV
jgi:hypothetical protein